MSIDTLQDVFSYMVSFTNLEKSASLFDARSYRLDRMHSLLAYFDNPHENFRVLHVAGTKGKGSTASFLASVLCSAGYRTGLYTSPHVTSYLERISVLNHPPEDKLFIRLGKRIEEMVMQYRDDPLPAHDQPTTFELLTLLAFLYFKETGCHYAVIETGIGGRLDATNVVKPELCLITPVELEHTDILGNTMEQIAREKGGIIKAKVPVFSGFQDQCVKEVFRKISLDRGSSILFLDEELDFLNADCSANGTLMHFSLRGGQAKRIRLSMLGKFQAENAALAYLALSRCFEIPEDIIQKGFRETFIPGRMEVIRREPYIVIDGAHTPRSIQHSLYAFQELFGSEGVLLFASVSGKKTEEMADILAPAFHRIIITTPGDFKESDPDETYSIFHSKNPKTLLIRQPPEAFNKALYITKGKLPLLVTGSFYLIGEIKQICLNNAKQPG